MAFSDVIPAAILRDMIKEQPKKPELNLIPRFFIDESCFTSINISYTWIDSNNIKGGVIAQPVDHPSFDALRQCLKHRGHIKIPDYPCWNGDIVLTPFYLNEVLFEAGDKFVCGEAMQYHIKNKG